MAVWALGINHTTAPLDLRGRFAYAIDQVEPTLAGPARVAVAPAGGRHPLHLQPHRNLLRGRTAPTSTTPWTGWRIPAACRPTLLRSHAYTLHDGLAARHAFRVASGLDSMVLGEPQILGQMKDAVRAADQAGALGTTLNQLFQRSFAVAKEVRTSTEIGAHSISMAAAAVRLAGQLFEDLGKIRVLFVGAGEMIELAATHFAARNPKGIAIANRTLERGERLASRFGGEVMRLADLPDAPARIRRRHQLHRQHPAHHRAGRRGARAQGAQAPPDVHGRPGRAARHRARGQGTSRTSTSTPWTTWPSVVQTGQANRQAAVAQAEAIIDAGVQSFLHWMDQRGSVPLIQQLNAQADEWRALELARARKLLAKGEDVDAVLEALSKGLTQKMLHGAMAELHAGDAEARERASSAIQHFFLRKER